MKLPFKKKSLLITIFFLLILVIFIAIFIFLYKSFSNIYHTNLDKTQESLSEFENLLNTNLQNKDLDLTTFYSNLDDQSKNIDEITNNNEKSKEEVSKRSYILFSKNSDSFEEHIIKFQVSLDKYSQFSKSFSEVSAIDYEYQTIFKNAKIETSHTMFYSIYTSNKNQWEDLRDKIQLLQASYSLDRDEVILKLYIDSVNKLIDRYTFLETAHTSIRYKEGVQMIQVEDEEFYTTELGELGNEYQLIHDNLMNYYKENADQILIEISSLKNENEELLKQLSWFR